MKINKINEKQLEPMVMILVGISCLKRKINFAKFFPNLESEIWLIMCQGGEYYFLLYSFRPQGGDHFLDGQGGEFPPFSPPLCPPMMVSDIEHDVKYVMYLNSFQYVFRLKNNFSFN